MLNEIINVSGDYESILERTGLVLGLYFHTKNIAMFIARGVNRDSVGVGTFCNVARKAPNFFLPPP